ncbi:hypothetical protein GS682_29815 [Nostoc sp. B(2019)]|nr:hypothetical protein [Nostoc sp. B(2019)]
MENNGSPSRLDQIESILVRVAQQQENNTQAIAQVTARVDQLTTKVDDLTEDVNYLREITLHNIELTQADREQVERDRQTFQAEIRRIWEYLLQQGGNGR